MKALSTIKSKLIFMAMILAILPTACPGEPYFLFEGSMGLEKTGAAVSVKPMVSTIDTLNFSSKALWSDGGKAEDAERPKWSWSRFKSFPSRSAAFVR